MLILSASEKYIEVPANSLTALILWTVTVALGACWLTRLAQARRRSTDRDYKELIESAGEAVFVADAESGKVIEANARAVQMWGAPRPEIAEAVMPLLETDGRFCHLQNLSAELMHGGSISREMQLVRPDESKVPVLVTVSLCRLGGRGTIAIFLRDIIDLKRADAALRESEQRYRALAEDLASARDTALEASRAKGQFLANMSHEIRTPINGVMGMLDLLLYTQLDQEQQEFAQLAHSSAESLLRIVNDILDFSRIEVGKLEIISIPFDIRQLESRLLQTMRVSAKQKALTLRSSVDPDVPELLEGDPERLGQILTNLIGNAIKFTSKGMVHLSIHRQMTKGDSFWVRFEVRDTGVGIPKEAQKRLFHAFSQADVSNTRQYGGTGLGLAISHHLVELMGGHIGFESKLGSGSTFWFELPLRKVSEASEIRGSAVRPNNGEASRKKRAARVLVVEDNEINRRVLVRQLQRLGLSVESAADGAEALKSWSESHFDLIVMDWQMPVMDGLEATRAIRIEEAKQLCARTPIVALTAHAMTGDRERCIDAGMDEYLTKPVIHNQLIAALQRWLPENSLNPQVVAETATDLVSV